MTLQNVWWLLGGVTLCSHDERSMSHSLCHPCQKQKWQTCKSLQSFLNESLCCISLPNNADKPTGGHAIKSHGSQKAVAIWASVSAMIPRDPFYRKPIEILSFHPDPQAEVVLLFRQLVPLTTANPDLKSFLLTCVLKKLVDVVFGTSSFSSVVCFGAWMDKESIAFVLPSIRAANQDPFWGQPSSGVDWCEANYVHSRYVAEFFNTMSSIPMLIVSLWGLFLCIKYQLEIRFYLCWFGIGVVGIGSVAFHGTLHPTGQQPGIYVTTWLKEMFNLPILLHFL